MTCQPCDQVIETLMEWLTGECSGDQGFGHMLTVTEVADLRLRRPLAAAADKEEE